MQGANNSGCRIPGQRRRTPRCREILPLTGGDGGDAGDAGDVRRPAPITGGNAGDVDDVNDGTYRRGLSQRAAVRE
jgi:hypothetical protein